MWAIGVALRLMGVEWTDTDPRETHEEELLGGGGQWGRASSGPLFLCPQPQALSCTQGTLTR